MTSHFRAFKNKKEATLLLRTCKSPVVALVIMAKAGSMYEQKGQRGWAHLLEHMLLRRTKGYPPFEIDRIIERSRAWFNLHTNAESVYFSAVVARESFLDVFSLAMDVVFSPDIQEDVLENEKKVVLEERRNSFDSGVKRLWKESVSHIFKGSVLSQEPLGEETDIMRADANALRTYHNTFFTMDRCVISVEGDVDAASIKK